MMKSFLFRCPDTGMTVQGFADNDEPSSEHAVRYEWVRCPACGIGHLVNAATGNLIIHEREKVQTIGF